MKSRPGRYEYLPHTADAKFVAHGKDLETMFANAAEAMVAIITDPAKVKPKREFPIEKHGRDLERLLSDFLGELLFLLDTEHFLPGKVRTISVKEEGDGTFSLTATVAGDAVQGYDVSCNVKAVTYNDMYVKKTKAGWECCVVVDL
ncbi:TPA: archease [Candidatus Woesearchaeota archaeon]|nr:archease [Candidatus Woesearchaeota archaeon]